MKTDDKKKLLDDFHKGKKVSLFKFLEASRPTMNAELEAEVAELKQKKGKK
jgi:hypothetical protein